LFYLDIVANFSALKPKVPFTGHGSIGKLAITITLVSVRLRLTTADAVSWGCGKDVSADFGQCPSHVTQSAEHRQI
jgi:hypothetical protein